MKVILFSALFLLGAIHSIAQTPISDTTIHVRGSADFYIDGIKVRSCRTSFPKSTSEEIPVSDTLNKRCPITISDFDMDEIRKNTRLIQLVKTDSELVLETIDVIIGGLPGTYGDLNSSVLQTNTTPITPRKVTISDKVQNLATE